jgi:hypothetical protein
MVHLLPPWWGISLEDLIPEPVVLGMEGPEVALGWLRIAPTGRGGLWGGSDGRTAPGAFKAPW